MIPVLATVNELYGLSYVEITDYRRTIAFRCRLLVGICLCVGVSCKCYWRTTKDGDLNIFGEYLSNKRNETETIEIGDLLDQQRSTTTR